MDGQTDHVCKFVALTSSLLHDLLTIAAKLAQLIFDTLPSIWCPVIDQKQTACIMIRVSCPPFPPCRYRLCRSHQDIIYCIYPPTISDPSHAGVFQLDPCGSSGNYAFNIP